MPGSVQGLHFVVFDAEASRAELVGRTIEVGEVFHKALNTPIGLEQRESQGIDLVGSGPRRPSQ